MARGEFATAANQLGDGLVVAFGGAAEQLLVGGGALGQVDETRMGPRTCGTTRNDAEPLTRPDPVLTDGSGLSTEQNGTERKE